MNDQEEKQPAPPEPAPQEPVRNEVVEQMERTYDRIQQMEVSSIFNLR